MDGGLTIVHRKNEGGIYLVDEKVIKVVDDIMGSGKSTWAINYINNNQEEKFLCVVPLLEECERFTTTNLSCGRDLCQWIRQTDT